MRSGLRLAALPVTPPSDPPLLAKPQSRGAAPRFAVFPTKFTSGRAGPPSAPPAPKTCTVTQTYKSGSPAVPGDGEGRWRCCWAHHENDNNSHQCAQARPSHPPPPKLARHLRLTNQAALWCQGEGRGRGWCCWAYPGTSFVKVETQGLARATQPTSRSETWQAGQANLFVGAYKFW
jgi:hypothetical protein